MTKKELLAEVARLRKIVFDITMNSISVTDVTFLPAHSALRYVKCIARVTINDAIILNLRVVQSGGGYFVGFPAEPDCVISDELSIVTPITKAVKERIERAVLKKYMENRNNA